MTCPACAPSLRRVGGDGVRGRDIRGRTRLLRIGVGIGRRLVRRLRTAATAARHTSAGTTRDMAMCGTSLSRGGGGDGVRMRDIRAAGADAGNAGRRGGDEEAGAVASCGGCARRRERFPRWAERQVRTLRGYRPAISTSSPHGGAHVPRGMGSRVGACGSPARFVRTDARRGGWGGGQEEGARTTLHRLPPHNACGDGAHSCPAGAASRADVARRGGGVYARDGSAGAGGGARPARGQLRQHRGGGDGRAMEELCARTTGHQALADGGDPGVPGGQPDGMAFRRAQGGARARAAGEGGGGIAADAHIATRFGMRASGERPCWCAYVRSGRGGRGCRGGGARRGWAAAGARGQQRGRGLCGRWRLRA
ncbi:hypothetical protein B0H17DRAFT_408679 [Mycena rosella]|uniref:Uncharacterized protein n=1 Tax=Mycena rosella TaxID=1033263 RepID=A0AAD7FZT6_MYCRO|nr:hypothetical protein B0H17DRAFT_408679 [Mycena rosella]